MNVRRKPRRPPYAKPTRKSARKRDRKPLFTTVQLSVMIIMTTLIFAGGAIFLKTTSSSAYDITVQHELQLFADFQKLHYSLNGTCVGEQGESLRNDGLTSTIPLKNYTLSKGVSITIVAGSPEDPYNADNPYTMQAKHKRSDTVYECRLTNDTIIKR